MVHQRYFSWISQSSKIGDETASHVTTSKNHEKYWKVDFQIDILGEAC